MKAFMHNKVFSVALLAFSAGLGVISAHAAQQVELLHAAVQRHDEATVRRILATEEGRAQLNQPIGLMRNTPLHWAVNGGDLNLVRLLLENGADQTLRDKSGRTPSFHAALWGHESLLRFLLACGGSVSERDQYKQISLHGAAGRMIGRNRSKEGVVRALLEYGADVNATGQYGSPLHKAVITDHGPVVRLLLGHGAAVDTVDKDGQTPLHAAAERGFLPIARVLLEHGANIDAVDANRKTPLRLALDAQKMDTSQKDRLHRTLAAKREDKVKACEGMVQFLLDWGADIEAAAVEEGSHFCLVRVGRRFNQSYTADWFRWEHPVPRWFYRNHGKVIQKRLEAIELWRDRLAQVLPEKAVEFVLECALTEAQCRNLTELSTWHAVEKSLHDAARRGHEIEVEALLKTDAGRAQIDQGERMGEMPLHLAGSNGSGAVARLLLSYGADVDARDKRNNTALHLAALEGHEDTALLLLDYGADIDIEDGERETSINCTESGRVIYTLTLRTQERLSAIRVWAGHLQDNCMLSRAVVEQVILQMALTDNQRRKFAEFGA